MIAAEVFICQELLDVPISVGIQALTNCKDLTGLREYWKKYRSEKRSQGSSPNLAP
jgi:hypothetical protein